MLSPLGNTPFKSSPHRPLLSYYRIQQVLSLATAIQAGFLCVCKQTPFRVWAGREGPQGHQILSAPYVGKEVCCVRSKPRIALVPTSRGLIIFVWIDLHVPLGMFWGWGGLLEEGEG